MTIAQLINYLIAMLCTIYQGHPPVVEDHPWPTTTTQQAEQPIAPTSTTVQAEVTTTVTHPAVTIPEYAGPGYEPAPTVTVTIPPITFCVDSAGDFTENC